MQTQLQTIIKQIIQKHYNIALDEVKLDIPPKKELGDFAFGAFVLAKDLRKSPNQIAEELTSKLKAESGKLKVVESVSSEGPYVNIRLSKSIFTESFLDFYEKVKDEEYFNIGNGQNVVIDYIGANVGKPLHIAHMCTPNQGQAIINIYKKLGYNIISDSHIGDWGIIFGKLILAYKMWGDEKKLQSNAVDYLFELYVKVNAYIEEVGEEGEQKARDEFKLLSEGNKESIEYWKEFTKYSIENLNRELVRLKIKPDFNIGESFYEGLDLPKLEDYPDLKYDMKSIVNELIEKGIATKNEDGSVGVVFDEGLSDDEKQMISNDKNGIISDDKRQMISDDKSKKKLPSTILQKRDGTRGYFASDLACIKYRMENWNPIKIIYFVDVRQSLHFQQAFEVAKRAGWLLRKEECQKIYSEDIRRGKMEDGGLNQLKIKNYELKDSLNCDNKQTELFHAYNGFISLKDGAMSTRKGRIIRLESLLNEAEKRAKTIILEKRNDIVGKELDELAKIIGIGAIKYGYLKKSRETDVIFDWDEFMNFEGNSGPYIQYSYVRAVKLKAKSGKLKDSLFSLTGDEIEVKFEFDEETELVKLLLDYKPVLLETAEKCMPHILCKYTFDLTKVFGIFYNNVRILDEKDESKKILRLKLVDLYASILKDAFSLLAIEIPEKM